MIAQTLRNPRPDNTYYSGRLYRITVKPKRRNNTRRIYFIGATMGSRVFRWGWNPVGGRVKLAPNAK